MVTDRTTLLSQARSDDLERIAQRSSRADHARNAAGRRPLVVEVRRQARGLQQLYAAFRRIPRGYWNDGHPRDQLAARRSHPRAS